MMKMIVGMAIERYGYDPTGKRNTATSQIQSDLDKQGIGLDDETIRKHLRNAKKYLKS